MMQSLHCFEPAFLPLREAFHPHYAILGILKLYWLQRQGYFLQTHVPILHSYWVVTDRWQRFSSLSLSEASLEDLSRSCDEFLVHGVDVEVRTVSPSN